MEKGVWGHRPVLEGGREGGGGGVRPFPFSTENSHIVAYSPPCIAVPLIVAFGRARIYLRERSTCSHW